MSAGTDQLGWTEIRLGAKAQMIVPMRDKPPAFKGETPWVRIEDFDGKYISDSKSQQYVDEETIRSMRLKVFPVGTVLCSCSCSMGATAIVKRPLVTNQTFIGIVPGPELSSSFLFYALQASAEQLQSQATGAIQQYLSKQDFRSLRLRAPSLGAQQAIADFLDRETGRIEALVSSKRRFLELLQEARDHAIAEAVTAGFSQAKRKATPIGPVALHWKTLRLKFVVPQITVGIVVTPARYYQESGIPCLRSLNVTQNGIWKNDFVFISPESNQIPFSQLKLLGIFS
jgi:type I restriction enzyme, S subunit